MEEFMTHNQWIVLRFSDFSFSEKIRAERVVNLFCPALYLVKY